MEATAQSLAEKILAAMPVCVVVTDFVTGKLVYWNPAVRSVLGYSTPLPGTTEEIAGLMHPGDAGIFLEVKPALAGGSTDEAIIEFRLRHADGSWRWFRAGLRALDRDATGQPALLLSMAADITDFKLMHERVCDEAAHDSLTGVLNHKHMMTTIEGHLKAGERVSVCVSDIDRFKTVNDTYGHAAGDEVLQRFAQIVRRSVRSRDAVGRLGGDEFCAVLLSDAHESSGHAVERIRREFAATVFHSADGLPFSVTASFGVAVSAPGMSAEELMARADRCLYEAKRSGRNHVAAPLELQLNPS